MTFDNWMWEARWVLRVDMNQDEILTISDVWWWFCYAIYAPGDGAIYLLSRSPALAQFLELTPHAYYSVSSLAISLGVWLILFTAFATLGL